MDEHGGNITAEELLERLNTASDGGTAAASVLREVLVLLCAHVLRHSPHSCGSLLAQTDALCDAVGASDTLRNAVHKARRRSARPTPLAPEEAHAACEALKQLIINALKTGCERSRNAPQKEPFRATKGTLSRCERSQNAKAKSHECMRCVVQSVGDDHITATTDDDNGGHTVTIALKNDAVNADFSYLKRLIRRGSQLNVLDATERHGSMHAALIVLEPDYILDVTAVAGCFEQFGHHPLMYTYNRLAGREVTYYTLLGNFAGSALDAVTHRRDCPVSEIIRKNYAEKAIDYAVCRDFVPQHFKNDAARQTEFIRQATDRIFADRNRDDAILEPSFVCERLGIQGRVDLMTADMQLIVEQKSGKNFCAESRRRPAYGHFCDEKHYVQVLLYYGILRYNFSLPPDHATIALLYSKYDPDSGYMQMRRDEALFREAIKVRNEIVAHEYEVARDGFAPTLERLTADTLTTKPCGGVLYERYQRPQMERRLAPLHTLTPLERDYMCRMLTFTTREQLLAKVGKHEGEGNSVADAWNMPLTVKQETGNIYVDLTVAELSRSRDGGAYDTVRLDVPAQGDDFLPNFREGDMVYLYAYAADDVPDIRRAVLLRGVIATLQTDSVTVHLNNELSRNRLPVTGIAPDKRVAYAIEHGSSDIGSNAAVHALYAFVTAPKERRDLLMGQRAPRYDATVALTKSRSDCYDDIVLRAMQARDYFLLIGPPGTGKTSRALRYIVEEELSQRADAAVLLLSYTNRAVDEICSMLVDAAIDFIRLGSEYSCERRFRRYIFGKGGDERRNLTALRGRLRDVRVVVGTTSALNARPYALSVKRFTLAVVDEAGQITEPNIVGLLCAATGESPSTVAIERFILVGDYKQLPAVVRQSPAETAVTSPELRRIGLRDCRESLFERLIRLERSAARERYIGVLSRQGRMHPDVANYPAAAFYAHERLLPVPLPHQCEGSEAYATTTADDLDRLLASHRTVFLASPTCPDDGTSEHVNAAEAAIIVDVLRHLQRLGGQSFRPERSVGIIVPYRNQIAMIRRAATEAGIDGAQRMQIDTVERFQGSERDVIIYSFTVHHRYQLEFLTASSIDDDGTTVDRKLNVAMTRARRQLILTGNPNVLRHSATFAQLLDHIKAQGGYAEPRGKAVKL